MSTLALGLVLSAALVHASWNLLAKKAGGGAAFVWFFSAMATVVYAPVALAAVLLQRPSLGLVEIAFMLSSATLHVFYFLFLQRAYRAGDLSLVYPVARGTGPLLATGLAILLLGERPTALALVGALFVVVGVFVLSSDGGFSRKLLSDLAVVFAPYHTTTATGTMHHGPHAYDTHVPLLLRGPGIKLGRYQAPAAPGDVAPTFAQLLGLTLPDGSDCRVLSEALVAPAVISSTP